MRAIPEMKITGDKEVTKFPRVRAVKGVRLSNLDSLGLWCGVSAEVLKTTQEMHNGFNESVTWAIVGGMGLGLSGGSSLLSL